MGVLNVGNGNNFKASSKYNIWGIEDSHSGQKSFIKNANAGDILWFKSRGQIIAMATFVKTEKRIIGPLITLTLTNEELGWTGDGDWNTSVYYKDLYDLRHCNLFPEIKGQSPIHRYIYKEIGLNLSTEYFNIIRYLHLRTFKTPIFKCS